MNAMGFKVISTGILMLLLACNDINGSPPRDSRVINNKEIVGQATNILTAKLLKGSIENNKNTVFSPIGFAAILAILGEGAQEETINDINTVLKYPDNRGLVRSAYRSVLSHLQGLDPHTAPQFRSWFYIYKNNTADESYKQILANDYYVTVRNVEPYNPTEDDDEKPEDTTAAKQTEMPLSTKTISDVEAKSDVTPTNSKDIIQFDSFKMEVGPVDETRTDTQKDASKFDEVVEDRQYIDVTDTAEHKTKETTKPDQQEIIKTEESKREIEPAIRAAIPVVKEGKKAPLPIKQFEEMEIMQAEESRLGKAFGGKSGEGASIISGNSLIGEKENLTESDTDQFEPKMLLFNGLYYHGQWATPFQHLRDDEGTENVFYPWNDQKVPIKIMRARGYFRTGKIEKYDSQVIELPYDNIRYSMLVIVPRKSESLKKLISEFNSNTLNEITNELQEELINVNLPKFEVQTTSGAEKVLVKEGLASLFTSKANFSGITKETKLRVGELQQHVTLRVDETSSTENFLTASIALRTNAANNERSVAINRPFLFFVRDRIDDVTIIAGKILSLEAFAMDEPEIPK